MQAAQPLDVSDEPMSHEPRASASLQAHPAAELFQLLAGDEYGAFKKDIADNGLVEPIWLCDGKILDGRNRYRACTELGIEPRFREYSGDSPTAFAWSVNGARRHSTTSQLHAVAVNMLPALQAEARHRQLANLKHGDETPVPTEPLERGEAVKIAAQQVGVGTTQIYKAKRVKESDPEVFAKIESGEITTEEAARIVSGDTRPRIKDNVTRGKPRDERAEEIRVLAADGNIATQIAARLRIGEQQVRKIARERSITLPDAAIGKVHKINAHRVIESTVQGLEGTRIAFDTIRGGEWDVAVEEAKDWHASLGKSIKELNWLRNKLGEIASGN